MIDILYGSLEWHIQIWRERIMANIQSCLRRGVDSSFLHLLPRSETDASNVIDRFESSANQIKILIFVNIIKNYLYFRTANSRVDAHLKASLLCPFQAELCSFINWKETAPKTVFINWLVRSLAQRPANELSTCYFLDNLHKQSEMHARAAYLCIQD